MTGSKKSGYERPNQKWVCGRAACGDPCLAGPDARGRCQAAFECRPLKQGDRWYCARPSANGGPCEQGPGPEGQCCRPIPKCQPKLSLRAWRGYFVLLTVATSVSVILLALTLSPKIGQTALSPGELSFQHSTYKSQCSDCHVNASSQAAGLTWITSHSSMAGKKENSQACLKCHNLGSQPLAPHAVGRSELEGLEAHHRKGDSSPPWALRVSALAGGNPMDRQSEWACTACHVEHRGKEGHLVQVSDLQCQSCHANQFSSFSRGHPEFVNYPFHRRTRIDFDHRSHLQSHFKDERFMKSAPNSCVACHTPDPKGSSMLVKSFEQACAACHLDQIKGKGQVAGPGIIVIRLPGMDAETLLKRGFEIGGWPEGAEGEVVPFMEWFLGRTNLAGMDFSDLSKADTNRLNQAADVAWSIKELIYDIGLKGQAEWERRVRAQSPRAEPLLGLLSAEVIRSMSKKWFPNLEAEITQHRGGKKMETPAIAKSSPSDEGPASAKPEEWVSRGGWYRSDLEYSLSYRPVGHADRFLQNWLDLTAAHPEARKIFTALSAPAGPGVCAKCHSIDNKPNPVVHWGAFQPDASEHRFTRFSHTAHYSLLDDRGCQTCHSLDLKAPAGSYSSAFAAANRDPSRFHSNFRPIQRQVCAECHTRQFAGEGCLKCHNYHIGHFEPTLPRQEWEPKGAKSPP